MKLRRIFKIDGVDCDLEIYVIARGDGSHYRSDAIIKEHGEIADKIHLVIAEEYYYKRIKVK